MSLFNRIFIATLKPILIGVVVAAMLLFFFPEFRVGSGLSLNLLTKKQDIPDRVSYYDALARSAPAVANIYSITEESNVGVLRNRPQRRSSLGSGVVMSADGYLVTCYHVIANATSTFVQLQDERIYPATLVGFDIVTDLAVLKIDATDLIVIPQVENTDLRIGDIVMAVGNPLDLGQTITSGIVSRTGRQGLATYFDFIQTDAALNQGNSGGALIDSNGFLVGITNARFNTIDAFRRVQTVEGVNFAVPYELAKKVMTEIIESGTVTRGELGVSTHYIRNGQGARVTAVAEGGPAHKAGIRENDVLLSISNNAESKTNLLEMLDMIAETQPGTKVIVQVNREGLVFEVEAVVGKHVPQVLARS
ncbi:MAG: trypsin-like peptidase domain-containing protein [Pseudomonadota bacterium]